jgi:hypothetical protein
MRPRALLPLAESAITRCSAEAELRHKIAQDLLDFRPLRSVCVGLKGRPLWTAPRSNQQSRSLLTEIRSKLSEAARIAKAAEACALAGGIAEGVTVSMDI